MCGICGVFEYGARGLRRDAPSRADEHRMAHRGRRFGFICPPTATAGAGLSAAVDRRSPPRPQPMTNGCSVDRPTARSTTTRSIAPLAGATPTGAAATRRRSSTSTRVRRDCLPPPGCSRSRSGTRTAGVFLARDHRHQTALLRPARHVPVRLGDQGAAGPPSAEMNTDAPHYLTFMVPPAY